MKSSAREEWGKGNARNDATVYTKPPPFSLAYLAGGFFKCVFSFVVGKERDTDARKPEPRSNQKTVGEGLRGEGSGIFYGFSLSSPRPLPHCFLVRPRLAV